MARLGIETGADLAGKDREWLRARFGSFGDYLHGAAQGVDHRPVRAHRIRKSIGGERTFSRDIVAAPDLHEALERIIDIVWQRIADKKARGRTVTLKLKYTDFQTVTRARSLPRPLDQRMQFANLARMLLDEQLPLAMPIRLMGLTLSGLEHDGLKGGLKGVSECLSENTPENEADGLDARGRQLLLL